MKMTKRRMKCEHCNKPIWRGRRVRLIIERRKRTNNIFRKAYSWSIITSLNWHDKCFGRRYPRYGRRISRNANRVKARGRTHP